ncbi:MAG: hypothetical protein KGH67_05485, partial [Candidatus Micrarchaeota archaeon]|nr:hypothetical protein [Candidatus Micrarchaeota archaeon]
NFIYQWYNFSSGFFAVPIANQISNSLTLPFNAIGNYSYALVVTDQGTTTLPKASSISIPVNITVKYTTYTATTCNSISSGSTNTSCSVSASTSPGIFCWSSAGNGNLNAPSWPVSRIASGESGTFSNVAQTGSPWTSNSYTCTASVSSSAYEPVQIAGLSVNANGVMEYGGEGGATANSVRSFSFTYNTDSGNQPEAVALMVSCGWWSCGYTINWPSGCSQIFMYPPGQASSVALALCNQMEGNSYTISDPSLGGPSTGVTFSYAKFENGTWNGVLPPPPPTPTLSASTSPNATAGRDEKFSATVSEGAAPYTYNFLVYNSVTNQQLGNDLTTSNTFNWLIPTADVGNTITANVFVTDSEPTKVTTNSINLPAITIGPSSSNALYTASTCNNIAISGTSTSCSVTSSSSPGVFCWASAGNGALTTPSWPISQSASGEGGPFSNVAQTGSPWTGGSTCASSVSSSSYEPVQIAGLSVSSNSVIAYGGEGGMTSNSVSSFSFTYNTDLGVQPEAVALMVSCGWYSCGSAINWPSGCNQVFLYPPGDSSSVALALCNQTEGDSYTISDPQLGGTTAGVAFSYAKFQNGAWS